MASTSAVRAAAVRPVRAPKPGERGAASTAPAPRLTVLSAPRTGGGTLPFTLLCTLIVAATLAALLYLNIEMSNTSYEITRLEAQSKRLTQEEQALAETNERLGTPQELERQARELGMVPVTDPAYIDLDTGEVLGETAPIEGTAAAGDATTDSVPVAEIYDAPTTYNGMGNEGD
ncbi:septum formation initiator family protein [Brachybacterium sp. DNPG3]